MPYVLIYIGFVFQKNLQLFFQLNSDSSNAKILVNYNMLNLIRQSLQLLNKSVIQTLLKLESDFLIKQGSFTNSAITRIIQYWMENICLEKFCTSKHCFENNLQEIQTKRQLRWQKENMKPGKLKQLCQYENYIHLPDTP